MSTRHILTLDVIVLVSSCLGSASASWATSTKLRRQESNLRTSAYEAEERPLLNAAQETWRVGVEPTLANPWHFNLILRLRLPSFGSYAVGVTPRIT